MADIKAVLEPLCARLDAWVRGGASASEPWVVLANVMDQDGRPSAAARDRLVLSLLSLQTDTLMSAGQALPVLADHQPQAAPPVVLNLYLLMMANFSDANYTQGLTLLSRGIEFFQRNPVLTASALPDLPVGVDRIVTDLVNLDFAQLSYVLSAIGAKCLPLVVYRLRSLPFVAQQPQDYAPLVSQTPLSPVSR